MTNYGRNFLARAMIGQEASLLDAEGAWVGVGNGTTPFARWQDGLQGSQTYRKEMDPGFPTIDVNQVTFQATFGVEDALLNWQEWGIFNAESGGVMFSRVVENIGVKGPNQSWKFTIAINLNHPPA